MKIAKMLPAFLLVLLPLGHNALSDQTVESDIKLGKRLVSQFWTCAKKQDSKELERMLAPGFQAAHQYGASTRKQELNTLKTLDIRDYIVSNLKVTRNGPVIVATYLVSVEETLKGIRLSKKPAPRLTVFLETTSGWKLIAHANLKSLSERKK